jgi:hypothetical protein
MTTYFTSITTNYLPKARVLAHSIKKQDPSCLFVLLIADDLPENFDIAAEPFDKVMTVDDLQIPNIKQWLFKHRLVELCTAIKGPAMLKLLEENKDGLVFYFDPDIAVFSSLEPLKEQLRGFAGGITPHQTEPERQARTIVENEMCSLQYGVFNLGFLGLTASPDGLRVAKWWRDRLLEHCYDDFSKGLFTDQRWFDLAPCFFPEIKILRDKIYNVATWNITTRDVVLDDEGMLSVDGKRLVFFHFSGWDRGAQREMLARNAKKNSPLFDLSEWYENECNKNGQSTLGSSPGKYSVFDNGEPITTAMRKIYRLRPDLQAAFPDPFDTKIPNNFYAWFQTYYEKECAPGESLDLKIRLEEIQKSKSYRLARILRKPWRLFLRNKPKTTGGK